MLFRSVCVCVCEEQQPSRDPCNVKKGISASGRQGSGWHGAILPDKRLSPSGLRRDWLKRQISTPPPGAGLFILSGKAIRKTRSERFTPDASVRREEPPGGPGAPLPPLACPPSSLPLSFSLVIFALPSLRLSPLSSPLLPPTPFLQVMDGQRSLIPYNPERGGIHHPLPPPSRHLSFPWRACPPTPPSLLPPSTTHPSTHPAPPPRHPNISCLSS